jgi:hypothetical protein
VASLANLGATARLILDQFIVAYRQLAPPGTYLPDRRYVAPGSGIPWDGEQLTVNLITIDNGQPGAPQSQPEAPYGVTFYATFGVCLVREVPGLSLEGGAAQMTPDAREIGNAGVDLINDATLMIEAGHLMHAEYVLTNPGIPYVTGPVMTVGPEGLLAGNLLRITLQLT